MIRHVVTIALGLAAVLASPALAQGPDWRVVGVAANDTLNLRAGPGTSFPVLGTLAPGTAGLRKVTCTPYTAPGARLSGAVRNQMARLPTWCLIAPAGRGAPHGWVNARYLGQRSGGQGGGQGSGHGDRHAALCAGNPTLMIDLSDRQSWRLSSGQAPLAVTFNRSPGWDAAARWMSAWPDGGRQSAGPETRMDFTIDFCSCGSQPATYTVAGLRVDDRAELFLDGTNWTDIGPNFRAEHPAGFHSRTHSAADQRQFMIRVHNDRTTQDNPTGLALSGLLTAPGSYPGTCRR